MFYSRKSIRDGQTILLRAVMTDHEHEFVDPSSIPQVYIYGPDVDSSVMDEEIEALTFTSAMGGPLTPVKLSTGFYQLEYEVPLGSSAGTYNDVWVATVGTTTTTDVFSFLVTNGVNIDVQRLLHNQLILVELDASISSYTGLTLASDIQLGFLTVLKPYYASPELVRMEIGPWIDFIPDATLALMIHWSSKEADFIQSGPRCGVNKKRLEYARAKFVAYDAVLRSMYLPGSSSYQPGGGSGVSKRLGDLQITNSAAGAVSRTASGIGVETLAYIRKQRDEWWRVVNAGGSIVPGQSLGFNTASPSEYHPDRRLGGRNWADPETTHYEQPAVNGKYRFAGHRKGEFWFRPNGSSGWSTRDAYWSRE